MTLNFDFGIPLANGITIVGQYPDLISLTTAYPTATAGDIAFVGTVMYYWDPTTGAWVAGNDFVGATGATPTFSIGTVGLDVLGGTGSVTIDPTSTATNVILDFLLPNPTVTATVAMLPAGSTPTVVVTQT
jgi:hypothetical protein